MEGSGAGSRSGFRSGFGFRSGSLQIITNPGPWGPLIRNTAFQQPCRKYPSFIRTLSGLVARTDLTPCALFQGAAEARSLAAQTIQYYGGEEGGKKLGHLARFTHHTQGHARQSLVQSQCSGFGGSVFIWPSGSGSLIMNYDAGDPDP
jgi:hypothetical protein